MHELLAEARSLLPETVELRRAIHRQPELGLDLPLTQKKVLDALSGLALSLRTGSETTSVIADIKGSAGSKTIILRGDMDALPLHEDTGLPFASAAAVLRAGGSVLVGAFDVAIGRCAVSRASSDLSGGARRER